MMVLEMDIARLEIMTYQAIKTTGTLMNINILAPILEEWITRRAIRFSTTQHLATIYVRERLNS
jgi:hypothetical protein